MRRLLFPLFSYFVLSCILLSALMSLAPQGQARNAQSQSAPSTGVSVSVKMIDAVDSQTDPAGKQYRASVAKAVNVASGAQIAQGTPATVVLAQGPNGWTTKLTSLTVGGQAIAVTSSSTSVTSAAQGAASTAANAVGSVFGGLGRRAPPAAVTAVATGQRVVLPPGVTLTFTVATPGGSGGAAPAADATPAASPAPDTPAVAAARPPIPAPATSSGATSTSGSPIPAPASFGSASSARPPIPSPGSTAAPAAPPAASAPSVASGGLTAMEICFNTIIRDPASGQGTMYLTAAFEAPTETAETNTIPPFEPAFAAYLKATYQYTSGITCQPIWSVSDAQQAQKKLTDIRDRTKPKVVNTGWRYRQPALAQGQSGFDPLAQGPGGLDLSQHRLTTYFCTLTAAGGNTMVKPPGPMDETAYVTPIFQADWDSAPINTAFDLYMRDHYVHDLNLSDLSPRCGAQSPALQASMHQGAGVGKYIGHKVPVDWNYTPSQAAEAHVATAQATASASTTAANERYVYCLSGSTGPAVYFSDIFAAVPTSPTTGPHAGRNGFPEFSGPFLAFLQNKYGYKNDSNSPVMCRAIYNVNPAGLSSAQATKKAAEDLAKQANKQVVETGWKNQ